MNLFSEPLFKQVIDHISDGVIITENHRSDWSICYVNDAFTEMTGYSSEDAIGKNPRFLQGDDKQQSSLNELHEALNQNLSCVVTLRNYTKSGDAFWNRLTLHPLLNNEGKITHYVGRMVNLGNISPQDIERTSQHPVLTTQVRDTQTGLYTQQYFEQNFLRDWNIWLREERDITLAIFTPDHYEIYRKTFGAAAAESALRKISYIVNTTLKRASDTCARIQDHSIVSLMLGDYTEDNSFLLDRIADKVHDLCIHHPHSPDQKYLTINLTAISVRPSHDKNPAEFLTKALQLHAAQTMNSNVRRYLEYTPATAVG